jgi:ferrous iron transport protein A
MYHGDMNNPFAQAATRSSLPIPAVAASLGSAARDTPAPAAREYPPLTLDRMARHCAAVVDRIDAVAAGQPPERARQLADIGFTPGERVMVIGRAWSGTGALVVLVGHSRFALRSAEAACVLVRAIA